MYLYALISSLLAPLIRRLRCHLPPNSSRNLNFLRRVGRLLVITLHISRVGTLLISSNNKVCRVGTLLLFCFKYRVGRLPFFQLENNITLNSISVYGANFLLIKLGRIKTNESVLTRLFIIGY